MSVWIGDYLKLRNEIHYLEFKLTDKRLSENERNETEAHLNDLLQHEGEFKIILNSFEDMENLILKKKYIEGKTLERISEELGYSYNYIKKIHAEIMRTLVTIEKVNTQLEQFKKNFPSKRTKK